MRRSIAGLQDSCRVACYSCLPVLDTVFSSIIVAPLVVGYWRSVWELMGIYVYPDDPVWSSWISTGIGIVGHLLFALSQNLLQTYFHPERNRILFYVFSRVYTVCFAFICVNGWRGPWQLLDFYTNDVLIVTATTVVGFVALTAMRALRNVSATPFAIGTDSAKGYFEVLTMFRVAMDQKTSLYILDCLFSVLVIGTLVVFVWRGLWAVFDMLIFPENVEYSNWTSLVLGYTTVVLAFLLQPVMKWICDRLNGATRLLVADLFLIFSLLGTVNVWRAIWNLLNLYLLPDNMELSCWITHWGCLIILILLGCSNSLLVRGVYIDAEEPAGKCVIFPCYYFRVIFHEKKRKREKQQNELKNVTENNHVVNIPENNHTEST